MHRILYRFLVLGGNAKPLVSARDRIMGTHRLLLRFASSGRTDLAGGALSNPNCEPAMVTAAAATTGHSAAAVRAAAAWDVRDAFNAATRP